MLKVKAIVLVQDESYDDNGVHITELYNRKAALMFTPHHRQSAEECIKYNIARTLSRIMDDVDRTLKVESTNDIKYFYEKNMDGGIWGIEAQSESEKE